MMSILGCNCRLDSYNVSFVHGIYYIYPEVEAE